MSRPLLLAMMAACLVVVGVVVSLGLVTRRGDSSDPVVIKALVRTERVFVAAGGDERGAAGVWISHDGQEWNTRPLDDGSSARWAVLDLDIRDGHAIGVGYVEGSSGDVASYWGRGMVLRVDLPSGSRETRARAVANGLDGTVVVGTTGNGTTYRPVAWVSKDEKTWTETSMPRPVEAADGNVLALDIVSLDAAGFVAVGVMQSSDRVCPVAWKSSDGSHWQLTPPMRECADGVVAEAISVVGSIGEAVAVGQVYGEGVAWRLHKGVRWVQERMRDESSEDGQPIESVSVVSSSSVPGGDVVVVGSTATTGNRGGAVWVRRKNSWAQLPDLGTHAMYTAALAWDGHIYVAGVGGDELGPASLIKLPD